MAYTKIHPVKSTLRAAIAYIINPDKTDGKTLISSYACSPETADIEFLFTLEQTRMRKGNNLAHHLIQSFDIGETTQEQAHEIGLKLADFVTKGQYEYILSTHVDKDHIHNHIMFCAASFVDQRKYVSNKRTLYAIRSENDRLCEEYNLSTIISHGKQKVGEIEYTNELSKRVTRPAQKHAQSWKENDAVKRGASWKENLRESIDKYIGMSSDFDDMRRRMEADGFTVKRAKYHSYKLPSADAKIRFTGGPSLGPEYTDERIKERIVAARFTPTRPAQRRKPDTQRINLLIDIEQNIKAQQSPAYAGRLQIINLKEAAKTLNYLTENGIEHYDELLAKVEEVTAANDQTLTTLKDVEKQIADLGILMKSVNTYRRTKPIFDQYRQARNPERFRSQHESEIILYEAARKAIKAAKLPDGKLPDLPAMRTEYSTLTQEKDRLYGEYGKLKQQVSLLNKFKRNIDRMLSLHEQVQRNENRISNRL